MLSLPEGLPPATTRPPNEAMTLADRWIVSRLRETVVDVGTALSRYDFGTATEMLWHFIWYEFCDWYVEATKAVENRPTRAAVLSFVWNNAMGLLHPIAPFISEEVWSTIPHDGPTVVTASWPDIEELPSFPEAVHEFELARQCVERVEPSRGARPGAQGTPDARRAGELPQSIATIVGHFSAADLERVPATGTTVEEAVAGVTARAPRGVLAQRYRREAVQLRSEVERGEKKLRNEAFVAKAAPDVVAKEREKLETYRAELARVEAALSALKESA